jgi:hypothetical protein
MNRDGETLDISTWRGVKKPLGHRYEARIEKKSMVNFLSVIFAISMHFTLHDDGIRPLTTFWPMEAIKASLQAPPSHRTTVLTPWMACCLAAGSRGRQHGIRRRHVHRRRWKKWVDFHPFLHCWSTKPPPPPPTVCTPLGYVYLRRVIQLPKPQGGD